MTNTASRSSKVWLALACVSWLAGCSPGCERLCNKLDRCGLQNNRTLEECQLSCTRELDAYKAADDRELIERYNRERRCLGSSTCDEIADGACYDEELFLFSADPQGDI